MSDDEKVGYGRPPKNHQFRPGESGNPRGRPKKRPPSYEDLLNALNEEVTVRQGNKDRKMHPFEAAVRKMVTRAVTDRSVPHALQFLALLDKHNVLRPMPAQRKTSGVLEVPWEWDWDEWFEMFARHGPPPWPGKRSGLTQLDEKQFKDDEKWMTKQDLENHRRSTSSDQENPETGTDDRKARGEEKR